MTMTIFLVLNGMGVVFLLYVLANFWKEGYRPVSNVQKNAKQFRSNEGSHVIVVMHPISRSPRDIDSVIPFQARERFARKLAPVTAINSGRGLSAGRFPQGEQSWDRETPCDTPAVMKKGRQS